MARKPQASCVQSDSPTCHLYDTDRPRKTMQAVRCYCLPSFGFAERCNCFADSKRFAQMFGTMDLKGQSFERNILGFPAEGFGLVVKGSVAFRAPALAACCSKCACCTGAASCASARRRIRSLTVISPPYLWFLTMLIQTKVQCWS